MKRYISLLLFILLLTVSCAPKNSDEVKTKMDSKGYNTLVYTKPEELTSYNKLYDIEGTKTVITAFKNSGTTIGDYCNIILFDNTTNAKIALNRLKEIDKNSEIKDQTVYAYKRVGCWVYYGTEQGMKDFEKN